MSLINPWAPHQGAGRYAMPLYLLEHKPLANKMREHIKKYYDKMQLAARTRTYENNPQKIHKEMKEELIQVMRQYARCLFTKIDQNIVNLEDDKNKALNHPEWNSKQRSREAAILDDRIRDLRRKKLTRTRDNTDAKFFLEGEVI